MLGKTFKGLTDELLQWQTQALLARERARADWGVEVRPELVVEVAFNDVQRSPQYPGGVALRFARVRGYRDDKSASEADTIEVPQWCLPPRPTCRHDSPAPWRSAGPPRRGTEGSAGHH